MVDAAAQYQRALKKKLRCGTAAKERLLEKFSVAVAAYTEEHDDATMDDLSAAFGPPEEMAELLMAEVAPKEQAQYRKNTLLKKVAAIILAVVLALFTIYVLFIKEFRITSTSEANEATNSWDETYKPDNTN